MPKILKWLIFANIFLSWGAVFGLVSKFVVISMANGKSLVTIFIEWTLLALLAVIFGAGCEFLPGKEYRRPFVEGWIWGTAIGLANGIFFTLAAVVQITVWALGLMLVSFVSSGIIAAIGLAKKK